MKIIAGVDEVGRGSLIGPVFAAAVILDKSIKKRFLLEDIGLKFLFYMNYIFLFELCIPLRELDKLI